MYIETGCLIQLASSTKVNHATRVTTLQLKQPICFYSDRVKQNSILAHIMLILLMQYNVSPS